MSNTVVKFENIGKSYMIGHKQSHERYTALRDIIGNNMKMFWSKIRHPEYYTHDNIEEFWALKNISFEIKEGDRLGIIGRNGAGKTTLLKVLSRITEPTTGKIKLKGRVASLLEVGTGFHPELTGRENIYLNGSILGMSRSEIRKKFDEIVDFAGVENFLDTPVKRFSSGMYVRLGFSVAAHLEPEILVVDEVLAVGDAAFQKKCLGKMDSVAKQGRTILFVSHQMQAVTNLCNRAILVNGGKIVNEGSPIKVVDNYINENIGMSSAKLTSRKDRDGTGDYIFSDVWISRNSEDQNFFGSEKTVINTKINRKNGPSELDAYLSIVCNQNGIRLFTLSTLWKKEKIKIFDDIVIQWSFITKNLPSGIYTFDLMIQLEDKGMGVIDYVQNALSLNVEDKDFWGTGVRQEPGLDKILVNFDYTIK